MDESVDSQPLSISVGPNGCSVSLQTMGWSMKQHSSTITPCLPMYLTVSQVAVGLRGYSNNGGSLPFSTVRSLLMANPLTDSAAAKKAHTL
jgi:hypothetical protein